MHKNVEVFGNKKYLRHTTVGVATNKHMPTKILKARKRGGVPTNQEISTSVMKAQKSWAAKNQQTPTEIHKANKKRGAQNLIVCQIPISTFMVRKGRGTEKSTDTDFNK